MKNKNLLWILGGLTLAGLGYFLFVKSKQKKDEIGKPEEAAPPLGDATISEVEVPSPSLSGLGSLVGGAFNFFANWKDYTVATTSTPLNVRDKADSKGKIVATLPKGSVIKAKASGVKGWLAVSKDGKNTLGYVSQTYLKPKL